MYAEPGKGAIHGAKDLRHGDVYLRLGLTLIGMYTLATLALSAVRRDDLSVLLDVD